MKPTHCFSVDVEGFCQGRSDTLTIPKEMIYDNNVKDEIASNIDEVLEFLNASNVKGTFFILGVIAENQPEVVKKIAKEGHEVASHSYEHTRLYDQGYKRAKEFIVRSKKLLEDITGGPIYGFRAPLFSINQETLYLLDIIRDAGFRYDSSIYPISGHDVYGIKGARPEIHRLPNGLAEFPAATYKVLGREIPALGGGYFRLYPLWISRYILRELEKKNHPAMFYIHPYEIGSRYPVFRDIPFKTRARIYVNMDKPKGRFTRLFKEFAFGRAIDILRERVTLLNQL